MTGTLALALSIAERCLLPLTALFAAAVLLGASGGTGSPRTVDLHSVHAETVTTLPASNH